MEKIKNLKNKIDIKKITSSDSFKSIVSAVICALIGMVIGFIILLIINAEHAPEAMLKILKNFMNYRKPAMRMQYFGQTLVKSVPLILCGLSVLFAYKAGLFNIGVGGQYCIAIAASIWAALVWHAPWWVCTLFAVVISAVWGGLAGVFKAFCNMNEVIACIMLNWISLYLVNLIMQNEKTMDITRSETYSIIKNSPKSLIPACGLNNLLNNKYASIAIPLTVVVAIVIMIVLNRTTFGYELKATGLNKNAAKYAGMKEKFNIIITMAIAGALAGLAASMYYLTDMQQWKTSSSVPGMGFNGIAVAFLGGLNPIGVIFAGYFIQHITLGGSFIDMRYYNPQIADLISSIIIYACGFVLFFKTIMSQQKKKNKIEKTVKEDK